MFDGPITSGPLHDWPSLDEQGLRKWAAQYVGWATNEMSDPDDLSWCLENQFPLQDFESLRVNWQDYYDDDVLNNPRYEKEFEDAEWHTPIVLSIEHDEIIIWDGWHRIATSIARGDECIMAIVGREISVPHS